MKRDDFLNRYARLEERVRKLELGIGATRPSDTVLTPTDTWIYFDCYSLGPISGPNGTEFYVSGPQDGQVTLPEGYSAEARVHCEEISGVVSSLNLSVGMAHAPIAAVSIVLIHPDGTSVLVWDGSGAFDNYLGYIYDQATFIENGPDISEGNNNYYTGNFAPVESFAPLIGKPVAGVWRVQIINREPAIDHAGDGVVRVVGLRVLPTAGGGGGGGGTDPGDTGGGTGGGTQDWSWTGEDDPRGIFFWIQQFTYAGLPTASSTASGSDPVNVLDANPATVWTAGASGQSILTFDFHDPQANVAYTIAPDGIRYAGASGTVALQVSSDGDIWQQIYSGPAGDVAHAAFTSPGQVRYARLLISGTPAALADVELYGLIWDPSA